MLTLILGAGLRAAAAGPGSEFKVEIEGSELVITVVFQQVPEGFAWEAFEASGFPEKMVGVLPADDADDRGRPGEGARVQLVSLTRVEEGIYRGTVRVSNGRWVVVVWPLAQDFDPERNSGTAETVYVQVGGRSPIPARVPLAFVAVIVVAALTWWLRSRASRILERRDKSRQA